MSKQVFQVLTEDRYGYPDLIDWFYDEGQADEKLMELKVLFPENNYWIEEGTVHIRHKCRCGEIEAWERHDYYDMSTGFWCDKCYEENYPYRKDAYFDPGYAGERMEEDY